MRYLEFPIGKLSEESQESRNKELKRAREFNPRKDARNHNNEDLMHFLLIISDPFITSLRNEKDKKYKPLISEAIQLLSSSEQHNLELLDGNEIDDS